MQQKFFFVSFWDLCLENLTEGSFAHRCLPPEQAKALIEQARQGETLFCVSNEDLLAPYKQKEASKHKDLCNALQQHYGISLSIQDFITRDEDDDLYSTNPLQIAQVQGETKLLVITCGYTLNKNHGDMETETFDIDDMFSVAPDSIEFHLLEAITAS